jgi:hypothetical protein
MPPASRKNMMVRLRKRKGRMRLAARETRKKTKLANPMMIVRACSPSLDSKKKIPAARMVPYTPTVICRAGRGGGSVEQKEGG